MNGRGLAKNEALSQRIAAISVSKEFRPENRLRNNFDDDADLSRPDPTEFKLFPLSNCSVLRMSSA